MKKLFRTVLFTISLLSAFLFAYTTVHAAETVDEGICGENLTWVLDDEGALTISGEGEMENFNPISAPWYAYRSKIKKLTINSGVTSIGSYAFQQLTNVTEVVLPEGVTILRACAFMDCSGLRFVSLPDTLYGIERQVFSKAYLPEITLPEGLKIIQVQAFEFCDFTYIEIPASVESIANNVFIHNTKLENIVVAQGNEYYSSLDGVLYNADKSTLHCYPTGKTADSFTIPNGVTRIAQNAFSQNSHIKEVIISDTVESIDIDAFLQCVDLERITIPGNVKNIGSGAFGNCIALSELVIATGVEKIGDTAFYRCIALHSVTIPDSVKQIGAGVFDWCTSLTDIVVDDNNSAYAAVDGVLYNKNLTQLHTFPCGKTLTSFAVPSGVTVIGSLAFSACSKIKEITLPDSVITIGVGAFSECTALERIRLSSGLETIEYRAFLLCDSLSQIVLPKSTRRVDGAAFDNCNALERIVVLNPECEIVATPTFFSGGAIIYAYVDSVVQQYAEQYGSAFVALVDDGTCGDSLLWYLDAENVLTISGTGKMQAYMEDEQPWFSYRASITRLVIEDGVSTIGTRAFMNCSKIAIADLADSVERIDEYAFKSCVNLRELQLPAKLTTFGMYALYDCDSLTTLHLPAAVSSIRYSALSDCDNLQEITVDESNQTYIAQNGILYNKGMQQLIVYPAGKEELAYTMPDSVVGAFPYAFTGVHFLEEVVFAPTATSISPAVFYEAESIVSVTLPETVTNIDFYVFYGCISLTNINIPSALKIINKEAFLNCRSLNDLVFPDTLTTIGKNAFANCTSLSAVAVLNPDCVIAENAFEESVTLYGQPDSTVQQYAETYGCLFTAFYDGVTWSFADGVLYVGTSDTNIEIPDSETRCYFPWVACSMATDAVVLENVSYVGANAFSDFAAMSILAIYGESVNLAASSFADCTKLHSVVFFADLTAETDAFIGSSDSLLFYAEQGKSIDGLESVVAFSLEEDDTNGNTVVFDQPVTVSSYDFFNLLIVICDYYANVWELEFVSILTTDFTFSKEIGPGEYEQLHSIEFASFTAAVFDEETEKFTNISFNELCQGLEDGTYYGFQLVVNDAQDTTYENIDVLAIQQFFLRAVVTLLNKILRLFNRT